MQPVLFDSSIYITALRNRRRGRPFAEAVGRRFADLAECRSLDESTITERDKKRRLHRPFGLTVGNLERVTRRVGAAHRGARSIGTVPPPAPWFEMHLRSAMAMLKLILRRRIAERP